MNEYITGIAEAGYDANNPAHVADYLSDLRYDLQLFERLNSDWARGMAAEIREAIEHFTPKDIQ